MSVVVAWLDEVLGALDHIRDHVRDRYDDGELAFLAITQKPEHVVRDTLAWRLHRQVGEDFWIAREWHRYDLAALDDSGVPAMLLEAKAYVTFDQVTGMRLGHANAIRSDMEKLAAYAHVASFELVANVHICDVVPLHLRRIVKYSPSMNAALVKHGSAEAVREASIASLREYLSNYGEVHYTSLNAGRIWDLQVLIDLFLVAIKPKGDLATSLQSRGAT